MKPKGGQELTKTHINTIFDIYAKFIVRNLAYITETTD